MSEAREAAAKQAAAEIIIDLWPAESASEQYFIDKIQAAIDKACAERDEELRRIKQDFKNLAETVRMRDEELQAARDLATEYSRRFECAEAAVGENCRTIAKLEEELRLKTARYTNSPTNTFALIKGDWIDPRDKEISDLTRDKERLDWLEEQRKGGRYEVFPSPHGLSLVSFRHHDEKGFPTAREAIDAARLT